MSNEAKHTIDSAKRAAAMDNVERLMPEIAKEASVLARIRRAHFDASIREGFTPEQALVLCMKPSVA